VVWIGYLQWKLKNGYEPAGETPILKPLNNIQCMDAIMSLSPLPTSPRSARGGVAPISPPVFDGGSRRGAASEPTWPAAEVIVGNPPFLGDKKMRAELGDAYVEVLRKLYEDRIPGQSDLCCYWFEKARAMIADGKVKRVGLLATQGIRGGANREVLKRIKESGDIFWAQSDREWIQDGVAVHVSMVGFDNGTEKTHVLNDEAVTTINADLTTSADLTTARSLAENKQIAFIGDMKKGKFDIPGTLAKEMLSLPPNPNGKSNSDVLRPWINGLDITRRAQGMWIIDFGIDMPLSQAALYEKPFEYVRKHVKPERDKVNNALERERWWLHARPAPDMRQAIKPLSRYIATARVAKHRLFVYVASETIPDGQVVVIARDDDYFFGVLHSKLHELWARATGTQLREEESGFRYTPTTTFETFPFPWPPGQEPSRGEAHQSPQQSGVGFASDRQSIGNADISSTSNNMISLANASPLQRERAIAQAAKELVELRDNWLHPYKDQLAGIDVTLKKRTLTNLYNENPTWLQNAHRKLDEAVFAAYGWPSDLSDDDILARLLELNLKRAGTR
jgi:type II restriction/modification system DNA methylase subunit YeeA